MPSSPLYCDTGSDPLFTGVEHGRPFICITRRVAGDVHHGSNWWDMLASIYVHTSDRLGYVLVILCVAARLGGEGAMNTRENETESTIGLVTEKREPDDDVEAEEQMEAEYFDGTDAEGFPGGDKRMTQASTTLEQVEEFLKPRIKDAVARKHKRVWIGTYKEDDATYEAFVIVEERKK